MRRRPARPLKAFGPGKVILLGEHAVVYGTTALAVPLAFGVRAEAVRAARCSLRLPQGLLGARRQQLEEAFSLAADACGRPPVQLSLHSTLPMSMGLGSSAAVSVAVARVLLLAGTGRPPSLARLQAVAHGMEVLFHGTPSGVDDACSALGVPIRFRRRGASRAPLVRPLRLRRSFELLVALAGERRPTLDTVAGLRRRQALWPRRYRRLFAEVGRVAEEGARSAEAGDLKALGDAMNVNQGLLVALGVSSPALDGMAAFLRESGALGAKLSGAGGDGGAVVGLFEKGQATRARARLARRGVRCFVSPVSRRP
ncbi:MAG: mevalonate kinase [Myxococcaceae bacterium]